LVAAVRRITVSATGLAALLAGLLVLRTLSWRSPQLVVEPGVHIEVAGGSIERLAGAVRLATISQPGTRGSDATAFEALRRHLETSYPKVHATLARQIVGEHGLVFTWNAKAATQSAILLAAHMDVVPIEPGTEAQWHHGPFSGDVSAGFVWGRGTLDDKVSLMAILEATEALIGQGFQPRTTVILAFGDDEETGGSGGAARIASLLKSRGIRLDYLLDEGSAITRGIVPGLDRPAALIGLAEKGFASVELSAVSAGGHSSMPPPQTAIGIVAAGVKAVEDHPMPGKLDGPVAMLFDRLGPEMPFVMRLLLANRWLFRPLIEWRLAGVPATNAALRTTAAATMFQGGVKENVLPAHARAVINFRIKPGDSIESVLAHVKRVVADDRVAIRLIDPAASTPASPESSPNSHGFKIIERTIRQVFPDALVAPSLVIAGTDSRHYQSLADDVYRFTPMVLGPDDTARIHGTDERIAIEGYRDCVRFYTQLLINENAAPE
jgi:carboxypeptidase PM20D1